MRRLLAFVLFFCWFGSCYASFFGSLSNMLNGGSHHSRKRSPKEVNLNFQDYSQYCTKNQMPYGFQLKCQHSDLVTNFPPTESPVLSCTQSFQGVSKIYPKPVSLSTEFISQLSLCAGEVKGPYTITGINVQKESSSFIQTNSLISYYDVVCSGESGYESTIYFQMQAQNDKGIQQNIAKCLSQIPQPQARNFVIMFYICIGLAIVSLILVGVKHYRQKKLDN